MITTRRRAATVVTAGFLLVAAACGGNSVFDETTSSSTSSPSGGTTSTSASTTISSPPTSGRSSTGDGAVTGAGGLGDSLFPGLGNSGYDVLHYEIALRVDPVANVLDATTTIQATALVDLVAFNLDLDGLDVAGLLVDGAVAELRRDGSEMTIVPPTSLVAGDLFVVVIEYGGTPDPDPSAGIPFPIGWNHEDGTTFVIAEPDGAQTWFPANDHLSDKATFDFEIDVPSSHAAVANGTLADVIDRGSRRIYSWEMDRPMATYLATVVVAPLEERTSASPEGIPIRNYFPPARADDLEESFAFTGEALDFFSSIFGPYPFDAYGVVVAGDFSGALETQTISIFGSEAATTPFLELIAVHEAAHQWFGNSVTPEHWQDIWLSEGFATYAEWLWVEHRAGRAAYRLQVEAHHDPGLTPPGLPAAADLFTASVYDRGALALHALRSEVGDDTFFAILREYHSRFAYGNASTADFVELAEDVAGQPLDDLLQGWVYAPEVPPLP